MKKTGTKALMAIDHVDWLFDLLCLKEEYIGRQDVRANFIKISKIELTAHSKTDQMYLNMLTALGFLENQKGQTSIYRRTVDGENLCKYRNDKDNQDKYRNILKYALLNSRYTMPFFQKLMAVMQDRMKEHNPIAITELESKYGFSKETVRTLRSLGKEAGMFTESKEGYLALPILKPNILSLEKFTQEIIAVYQTIIKDNRSRGIPMRTPFARIGNVRSLTCAMLNIEKEEFDKLFGRMLEETQIGRKIDIFGAAPQFLPEQSDPSYEKLIFKHKGKIYVFMSM